MTPIRIGMLICLAISPRIAEAIDHAPTSESLYVQDLLAMVPTRPAPEEPMSTTELGRIMETLRRMEETQHRILGDIETLRGEIDAIKAERSAAIRLQHPLERRPANPVTPERSTTPLPESGYRTAEIDPEPGTAELGYRYIIHPQTGLIVPVENEWHSYINPGGQARILEPVRVKGRPVVLKSAIYGMVREPNGGGAPAAQSAQQGLNMNFGN